MIVLHPKSVALSLIEGYRTMTCRLCLSMGGSYLYARLTDRMGRSRLGRIKPLRIIVPQGAFMRHAYPWTPAGYARRAAARLSEQRAGRQTLPLSAVVLQDVHPIFIAVQGDAVKDHVRSGVIVFILLGVSGFGPGLLDGHHEGMLHTADGCSVIIFKRTISYIAV